LTVRFSPAFHRIQFAVQSAVLFQHVSVPDSTSSAVVPFGTSISASAIVWVRLPIVDLIESEPRLPC
jgi:hypothetical protein